MSTSVNGHHTTSAPSVTQWQLVLHQPLRCHHRSQLRELPLLQAAFPPELLPSLPPKSRFHPLIRVPSPTKACPFHSAAQLPTEQHQATLALTRPSTALSRALPASPATARDARPSVSGSWKPTTSCHHKNTHPQSPGPLTGTT